MSVGGTIAFVPMTANECAAKIRSSLGSASPSLSIEAQPTAEGEVAFVLTTRDAQGRVEDIIEQRVSGIVAAAEAAGPERFDAYLAAVAEWLRAQKISGPVLADQLFSFSLLADSQIATTADFSAVLMDPQRRELYDARDELRPFFARHGLVPANDDVVRALFALTPEGRAAKGLAEAARSMRWLASFDEGRLALVAMLREWADEDYDPYDLAWDRGPAWPTLLISAAWRTLDPFLQGEQRMQVLASVDRLAQPVDAATLARAGF